MGQPVLASSPDDASGTRDPRRGVVRRALDVPEIGVLAALVTLLAIFTVWQPAYFATVSNIKDLLADSSILVILAMATTFVIIAGQIDLSIGGIIAFTEMVTAKTFQSLGGTAAGSWALVIGLAVALASGLCWGALNGVLATRLRLAPFVVTLATLGIAQGAAYVLNDGANLATIPASLTTDIGIGSVGSIPTLVWIAAAVTLAASYVLRRTRFGRHTYAVGSDALAAERAGIRTTRHILEVYAFAGLAYGLAAYLNLARYSTTSVAGHDSDALNAVTAVALGGVSLFGGVGTTLGSLVGVFIPGVLQNGFVIAAVQPFYAQIGTGIALVVALYADKLRRSRSTA